MGTLSTIEELTKDGAASVLFYEIAGTSDLDNKCCVVVNKVQPPLPSYFRAETFAKALDAAVEASERAAADNEERAALNRVID